MAFKKPLIALVMLAVLMTGIATPGMAHETQNVEGYDITFGGADEPLITGERMWVEFEIVNNETGEPVTDQAENLTVSVQTAESEKTALELSEKHGEPGVYEAPVIFTGSGDYVVHLEGSVEGTEVHTHFEKEVRDHITLEYPSDDSQTEGGDSESQTDDSQTDEAGFGSLSVAIVGTAVVAGIGTLLLRRQR
ncbi:FixH family protein [Natrinema zhouii]|uniref:FixH family protein n=1 Tax=Natrinema zhouii TaxID=1710539 RepID=A0A7D6GR71_9EURY|nr:FixH family protein [Natrinema zhouii]QLK27261.1 FixH family protein [Natrinema zhouii]